MTAQERIGQAMNRLYDRMRHVDAFTLTFEGGAEVFVRTMQSSAKVKRIHHASWAHAEATLAGTSAR